MRVKVLSDPSQSVIFIIFCMIFRNTFKHVHLTFKTSQTTSRTKLIITCTHFEKSSEKHDKFNYSTEKTEIVLDMNCHQIHWNSDYFLIFAQKNEQNVKYLKNRYNDLHIVCALRKIGESWGDIRWDRPGKVAHPRGGQL